jgi:hypothetical protein
MDIFLDEHRKFLALLLKYDVEFLLIGGYAVIVYGYERGTGDMDIWLNPTDANKRKFMNALQAHGIQPALIDKVGKLDFSEVHMMHLGERPIRIDFLTRVHGLDYPEANEKRQFVQNGELRVPVIDYEHLILVKMLSGRPQDKADVDMLKGINRHKKGDGS